MTTTITTARRLAPLSLDQIGPTDRALLAGSFPTADRFLRDAGDELPLPNVLGLFAHHPQLTAPFLALNATLSSATVLPLRDRELLILRVSWRTQCAYEWGQHARLSRDAGLTDDERNGVALAVEAYPWSARDRALITATDELLSAHVIADGTWAELTTYLDERQLLEVLFIVGTYLSLALVMNSVGLAPDPGSDTALPIPSEA